MTTTTKLTSFHSQPVVVTTVYGGRNRVKITEVCDQYGENILPIMTLREVAELENQVAEEMTS